jgi:hypothetical protein
MTGAAYIRNETAHCMICSFCTVDLDTQYHVLLKSSTVTCCNCLYGKYIYCITKNLQPHNKFITQIFIYIQILPELHKFVPSSISTNTDTLRYMWYDIYYRQLKQHTL